MIIKCMCQIWFEVALSHIFGQQKKFSPPCSIQWCVSRDAQFVRVGDAQGPTDKCSVVGFILEQVSACPVKAVISDMEQDMFHMLPDHHSEETFYSVIPISCVWCFSVQPIKGS